MLQVDDGLTIWDREENGKTFLEFYSQLFSSQSPIPHPKIEE